MQSGMQAGGGGGHPLHQQQQHQQQHQQQAQQAVSQAVQQAMQQRQQQGQGGAPQSITDLAVSYMSAIGAASKQGGAGGPTNLGMLAGGMGGAGGGAGAGAGGMGWDPRLSYPMMSHMNTLNAMTTMPSLLSLQQQYTPSMMSRYNLDPNSLLSGSAAHGLLHGLDARKSRHIKSPQQLKTLKLFFVTNQRPSKEEIRKLVKDTGLPHQEVTRWFRNERHKEKKQQEAKQEAIQGHLKGNPVLHQHHPNMHINLPHMQHPGQAGGPMTPQQAAAAAAQQAMNMNKKRKIESGSEAGSEGEDPLHQLFNMAPQQRLAAVQSLLATFNDQSDLDAAEKILDAKRVAMGGDAVPSLPRASGRGPPTADNIWSMLEQAISAGKDSADAKRRKAAGGKSAAEVAAAAAAASGSGGGAGGAASGINPDMIQSLTQMFTKHPEYLKEINKNLMSTPQP